MDINANISDISDISKISEMSLTIGHDWSIDRYGSSGVAAAIDPVTTGNSLSPLSFELP